MTLTAPEIDDRAHEDDHKEEGDERCRVRGEGSKNFRNREPILGGGLREKDSGSEGVEVRHDGFPD
jgi:hypothetical protein